MTVSSYLFQSPYNQPFQVGRPDPSSVQAQKREQEQVQSKVESNTQQVNQNNNAYETSQIAVKSSVAYASSGGAGLNTDQVQQLSDASLKANQSSYVKVYEQNA